MMTSIADCVEDQMIQSDTINRPSTPTKNISTYQINSYSPISTQIDSDDRCKDNTTKDPLIDTSMILCLPTTPKGSLVELTLSPSPILTNPRINPCDDIYLPGRGISDNKFGKESDYQDDNNFIIDDEDLEDNILPHRRISNGLKIRLNSTLMYLQDDPSYKSISDLNFENDLNYLKKHSRNLDLEENDMPYSESPETKEKRSCHKFYDKNNNIFGNPKRNHSPKKTFIQKKRC